MSAPATSSGFQIASALRALVLHGLLFILLVLTGIGLSMLLGAALRGFDTEGDLYLEMSIAISFTAICCPLALLLWRLLRQRLADPTPVESLVFSVQGAAVYLIALITSSGAVLELLALLVSDAATRAWQPLLGTALSWGLVGIWQLRMLQNPRYAPRELPALALLLGHGYTLVLAGWGLMLAVRASIDLLFFAEPSLIGASPLPRLSGAVLWALGALAFWFWHEKILGAQRLNDRLASVLRVLLGICLPAAATLGAAAALLNIAIPLPADAAAIAGRFEEFGGWAIAGVLVGALLWIYHQGSLSAAARWLILLRRQVISGIALALLASGLGMMVNALLAAASASLSSGTAPAVLRTGIALLVIGAMAWSWQFRPLAPADPESRRIYLVLFFGCSALVALVSLLVIGYRVVTLLLGGAMDTGAIDYLRAPIGWLVSTAGVAAYHFALWKADRQQLGESSGQRTTAPASQPLELTVVAALGSDALLQPLRADGQIQLRFIPAAGDPVPVSEQESAARQIAERLAQDATALLAQLDQHGQVHFTCLVAQDARTS